MEKELHVEPLAEAPGLSGADIFRYIPLLMKILAAAAAGEGTFSTASPKGKRWIRVQSHPFDDTPPPP